jgi:hypothetical protein
MYENCSLLFLQVFSWVLYEVQVLSSAPSYQAITDHQKPRKALCLQCFLTYMDVLMPRVQDAQELRMPDISFRCLPLSLNVAFVEREWNADWCFPFPKFAHSQFMICSHTSR